MEIFKRLKERFKDHVDSVVFEIGAYDGNDTNMIYSCIPQISKYIAFEPDKRNISKLQVHPLIVKGEVTLVPMAVSDKVGFATFYVSSGRYDFNNWSQSSSILKPTSHLQMWPNVLFPEETLVRTTTLDVMAAVAGIDYVDFMWIDVQGAEHLVLAGGSELLKRTSWVYTEFSNIPYYEGQACLTDLMKLLPGEWEVVENYGDDVLLNNLNYGELK